MSHTIVEEEPYVVEMHPTHIAHIHRVLTETGGSNQKHSSKYDESFGGPEYKHLDDSDKEVRKYPLQSVTDLETGEELSRKEAEEKLGELFNWYGSFYEAGFLSSGHHTYTVPDPDESSKEYRVVYEEPDEKGIVDRADMR